MRYKVHSMPGPEPEPKIVIYSLLKIYCGCECISTNSEQRTCTHTQSTCFLFPRFVDSKFECTRNRLLFIISYELRAARASTKQMCVCVAMRSDCTNTKKQKNCNTLCRVHISHCLLLQSTWDETWLGLSVSWTDCDLSSWLFFSSSPPSSHISCFLFFLSRHFSTNTKKPTDICRKQAILLFCFTCSAFCAASERERERERRREKW